MEVSQIIRMNPGNSDNFGHSFGTVRSVQFSDIFAGIAIVFLSFFLAKYVRKLIKQLMLKKSPLESGKWVIITGSTGGIGRALAKSVWERGCSLVLIDKDKDKLEELQNELRQHSTAKQEVITHSSDFTDFGPAQQEELAKVIADLDVCALFNNCGLSFPRPMFFEECSQELIINVFKVNTISTIALTQMVLPKMIKRGSGAIVFTGSASSQIPSDPLYSTYAASKAAIATFAKTLSVEVADRGILVQCHTPLLVSTAMSKARPSRTVPKPESYVQWALAAVDSGIIGDDPIVSPHPIHRGMLLIIRFTPKGVWNRFRINQTKRIRFLALKKPKTVTVTPQ